MESMLRYLSELEFNNERIWYHANKNQFKEANAIFEELIQDIILGIGKTDESILWNNPHNLTFRLMRDIRYSYDKSPYNPSFRAHISAKGKLPIPVGYFVRIKPNNQTFIGGGLFSSMLKDATAMIRNYISLHGEEWLDIVNSPSFVKNFVLKGEKLKNVPRLYDREHPQGEYLKHKSWYIEYNFLDELIVDREKFVKVVVEKFELMQPFNAFINKALKDFKMPIR